MHYYKDNVTWKFSEEQILSEEGSSELLSEYYDLPGTVPRERGGQEKTCHDRYRSWHAGLRLADRRPDHQGDPDIRFHLLRRVLIRRCFHDLYRKGQYRRIGQQSLHKQDLRSIHFSGRGRHYPPSSLPIALLGSRSVHSHGHYPVRTLRNRSAVGIHLKGFFRKVYLYRRGERNLQGICKMCGQRRRIESHDAYFHPDVTAVRLHIPRASNLRS